MGSRRDRRDGDTPSIPHLQRRAADTRSMARVPSLQHLSSPRGVFLKKLLANCCPQCSPSIKVIEKGRGTVRVKDESGKGLAVNDRLKIRFPYEGVCNAVVEQFVPDAKGSRGKKGGMMIVSARFAVPFEDEDSVKGLIKMPSLDAPGPADYEALGRAGKRMPKGIAKVSKAAPPAVDGTARAKEKRRA